uniref:Gtpase-activating protein centaurin gamma n=1 Tax=Parascaris univalens TaxID=6257 RepID=A0A915CBT6_PARUN
GALFRELFYRKSKGKENGYRTPVKVKPQERPFNGYYRTPSCDSAFRLPYRCPLDKMRNRTPLSTRRHSKQPPVRVLSFVSLLPEAKTLQYAGRTDAFVNSQEWTLSRGVPELKLGVVGSLHSGKTSLVHRYLTGAYTSEESPEGGRFKKEVVVDGQSYLLLIRDEGSGVPEYQFAQWVDAVIFVFSLESQDSFETVLHYYNQMAKYRNLSDVPILLVGTQDAISESNPRVIDEHEGRQMAKNLPRCGYYETCSTYGLNVERVFKDACQKIIQQRLRLLGGIVGSARTPTPTTLLSQHTNGSADHRNINYQEVAYAAKTAAYHHQRSVSALPLQDHSQNLARRVVAPPAYQPSSSPAASHVYHRENSALTAAARSSERSLSAFAMPCAPVLHPGKVQRASQCECSAISPAHSSNSVTSSTGALLQHPNSRISGGVHGTQFEQTAYLRDEVFDNQVPAQTSLQATTSSSHLPTPSSTPTTQRRNRRISNLFQRPKESHHNHEEKSHKTTVDLNMGMGRAIPVKQGHLYKRSSKTLNKEWKKKYVCLHSDGRLSYHQTLKDYMEKDASGKEVFLGLATVKVAGRQRPRATQRAQTQPITVLRDVHTSKESGASKRESLEPSSTRRATGLVTAYEFLGQEATSSRTPSAGQTTPGEGTSGGSDDQQMSGAQQLATSTSSSVITAATPALGASSAIKKKKGHRRLGSGTKNHDEDEDCEFEVVTCDQKRWEFSATSVEERDEWVHAIEELIEKSLQAQMSQKQASNNRAHGDKADVQALRQVAGNDACADCGAAKPDWASLNLGTLICIECSGIHRNLGSHVSKVRSLELDEWPIEHLTVMEMIGNTRANSVWEFSAPIEKKPRPDSTRDEKERWIKQKYELKRFLPPLSADRPLGRQLLDAVFNNDLTALLPILPRCGETELKTTVDANDKRTALHIACSNASSACTQLLVWYNADVRMLDNMGRSALWHAQTAGAFDCVSILINAGLDPSFGVPSGATAAGMITGSLSSRDYYTPPDSVVSGEAKLRRQSDAAVRRVGNVQPQASQQPQQVQPSPPRQPQVPPAPPSTAINGFHQRAADAFERLPASVI